ncbi:MAG TPA: membrane protein insertase YidC [Vicinamibacteria bacterium]|nr:membrane protein insertase YidC [Vicinamibacteria bacterium]
MEERRLLLAVALSLLVLTGYQLLFAPAPPPRPSPAATSADPSGAPPPPSAAAASPAPSAAPPPSAPVARVADERERRVEVQGEDLLVAFANKGARLLSWKLRQYRDVRGRPEEMVLAVGDASRSLDLETGEADVDARLREALFRPSSEQLTLRAGSSNELRFDWAEGELEATKVLRFPARGYLVEVEAQVRREGRALPVWVLWGPGVGNPTPAEMDVQGYVPPQGVFLGPDGVERVTPENLRGAFSVPRARWIGVESRWFAALWVPPAPTTPAELRAVPLPAVDEGKGDLGMAAAVGIAPAAPAVLFVGPKDHQVLSHDGHELARVVDVGDWIGPIVIPLMALLRWAHSVMGNYGWAIVLLTLLINLAMAPFRHYSIANGLKMAKLAPEMRTIQERYRKVPLLDPKRQEMQQEIAALYARHGMSMGKQMAVGCVPILLTMPFLIGFYRVLQVSIELRGASFLWIPDLSQTDPLFVTPVLMGLSMFVMQKMVPTTMDPAQQRIMMIMPVVLAGMFLWAPAGLNLYWLAANLCSIVQQGLTMRLLRDRGAPAGKGKERRRA